MNTPDATIDILQDLRILIEYLNGIKGWGIEYLPYPLIKVPKPILPSKGKLKLLEALKSGEIGECLRCPLHKGRRTIVFGEGNPDAILLFVGEAPGRDEDIQGSPFVGAAGQLLTKIIEAIDLRRKDVYITNVIKCRPPNNREPEDIEIKACRPFLMKQVGIIKPKIICALGKFATQTLLGNNIRISQTRGKIYNLDDILVVPTYHPSFLLRNPSMKRPVWEDMKMIKREYDRIIEKGSLKE